MYNTMSGASEMRSNKKTFIREQRYNEIERENRMLLNKMQNIMQTDSISARGNSTVGRRMTAQLPPVARQRSLNVGARKKQEIKIAKENA